MLFKPEIEKQKRIEKAEDKLFRAKQKERTNERRKNKQIKYLFTCHILNLINKLYVILLVF